eukprot:CAMPEP_0180246570 /NCGR_PEP_ID=MMETSP0987-20121128/35644_1 /TAXON_ID=697907 /ORGANISM="non described non described, Strain CCMP2293" /LENGTH=120 /DNA_ID=CAMNT_0022214393 /DNA_START=183 /DNA_END=545 /DNA_ORIENTATION=-
MMRSPGLTLNAGDAPFMRKIPSPRPHRVPSVDPVRCCGPIAASPPSALLDSPALQGSEARGPPCCFAGVPQGSEKRASPCVRGGNSGSGRVASRANSLISASVGVGGAASCSCFSAILGT